jgi:hypothetical protein
MNFSSSSVSSSPLPDIEHTSDPFDFVPISTADPELPCHRIQRELLDSEPCPRIILADRLLPDDNVWELLSNIFHCQSEFPTLVSAFSMPSRPFALFFEGMTVDEFSLLAERFPALSEFQELDQDAIAVEFCNGSRMLGLSESNFVVLTNPPFAGSLAQVMESDVATHRVRVRVGPCPEDEALAAHNKPGQTSRHKKPFHARRLPPPVTETVLPCKYKDGVVHLKCWKWQDKFFYGPHQVVDVDVQDVKVCVYIAITDKTQFIEISKKPLSERRGWPAPRRIVEAELPRDPGVVVGQPAIISEGPSQGLAVHVQAIAGDSVIATTLPIEVRGHIRFFDFPEGGFYSTPIPAAIIPVDREYRRGELVRLKDDSLGIVIGHVDDDLQLIIFPGEHRQVSRFQVVTRVSDDRPCFDHRGLRICVGEEVRFPRNGGLETGIVVRIFQGHVVLRKVKGDIADGVCVLLGRNVEVADPPDLSRRRWPDVSRLPDPFPAPQPQPQPFTTPRDAPPNHPMGRPPFVGPQQGRPAWGGEPQQIQRSNDMLPRQTSAPSLWTPPQPGMANQLPREVPGQRPAPQLPWGGNRPSPVSGERNVPQFGATGNRQSTGQSEPFRSQSAESLPAQDNARRVRPPWWALQSVIVTVNGEEGKFVLAGPPSGGSVQLQLIDGTDLGRARACELSKIDCVRPSKAGEEVFWRAADKVRSAQILGLSRDRKSVDLKVPAARRWDPIPHVSISEVVVIFDWKSAEDFSE